MPQINIDLSKEEYDAIPSLPPGKKRGWCRGVIQEALKAIQGTVEAPVEQEYVFQVNGREVPARGLTPADAARKGGLGGDPTLVWRVKSGAPVMVNPMEDL